MAQGVTGPRVGFHPTQPCQKGGIPGTFLFAVTFDWPIWAGTQAQGRVQQDAYHHWWDAPVKGGIIYP